MSQVIWKFTLLPTNKTVQMPRGARVLSVGVQGDDIVLWAIVEPTNKTESRFFHVIPTGSPMVIYDTKFIGTVQMGPLVFHVFEEPE